MSERKVLNKYYPADYDPSKIPRMKGERVKQFAIRVMAPFNMRCDSCGEYIYKGKKFNSRMENVEGESYLGIPIRRFYIKCTRCVSEITFRTDPESVDYVPEHGATRLFEALRTAEKMAEEEEQRKLEEEADNPMKQLEKRTAASQREIETLEALEELKELNARHAALDHELLLDANVNSAAQKVDAKLLAALQEEEDERIVREAFGKRKHSSDDSEEEDGQEESAEKKLAAVMSWKKVKSTPASSSADFAAPAPVKGAAALLSSQRNLLIRRKGANTGPKPSVAVNNNTSKAVDAKTTSATTTTNPNASSGPGSRALLLQYSSSDDDSD